MGQKHFKIELKIYVENISDKIVEKCKKHVRIEDYYGNFYMDIIIVGIKVFIS